MVPSVCNLVLLVCAEVQVCRLLDLGFGVKGLGFRLWDLGFTV